MRHKACWIQLSADRPRERGGRERSRAWRPRSAALLGLLIPLLFAAPPAQAQQGSVGGTVVNEQSLAPLSGVQVTVVGTRQGTITDTDGRFIITGLEGQEVTLRVELIGYGNVVREVQVGTTDVRIALSASAITLDEVVVTGTAGSARRREVGNSISAVRAEQLEMQPITNVQDALSANVPGLTATSSDGAAGAGGSIRLRGVNSITQGNRPLLYVDGVRMNSGQYRSPPGDGLNPRQQSSPLNDINPGDIARIEVIKGAAATTLYGTEASGGVIQIFTKSGAGMGEGEAVWTAGMTQGISQLATLGGAADQSAAWFDEFGPESEDLWMREWLRDAHLQSYDLSVRGRAGNIDYYVSGGWKDEEGVIPTQGSEDWNVRGNVGFQPTDPLKITFNNSISSRAVDWVVTGNQAESFVINVMRGPYGYGLEDKGEILEMDLEDRQSHFVSSLDFVLTPVADWTNRLTFGLDFIDQDYAATEPFGGFFYESGRRTLTRWQSITRTVELASTYDFDLSSSISTSTSAGFQAYHNQDLSLIAYSENFSGPGQPTINSGAIRNSSESRLTQVNAGFFVQEMVGFADKLFVTAGLRVDGNSAFGEDFGLQPYPKLSASYIISDEGFWPEAIEAMKLRAAYGESGKAPGYFDATRVWAPISAAGGLPAVVPSNLGNPDLGPERTREIEVGFEASALNGRVALDGTYYHQTTSDALIAVPLDPTLGFGGSQLQNVGSLQNKGVELSVNVAPVETDRLRWDLGVTLSTNESEMLDTGGTGDLFLGSLGALGANQWVREGYPVPSHFSAKLMNPDEIGAPEVAFDEYIGPVYPTHSWFFSTNLALGDRLNVNARAEQTGGHFLQSGTAQRNMDRGVWPPCFDVQQRIEAGQLDQLTAKERWKCNSADSHYPGSYISPADFFKLRSVSLQYDLPQGFVPVGNTWTLNIAGQNLFTLTDYDGIDPEAHDGTGGIGSDTFTRVEYYNLPPVRRFTFGVRTTF